jgi:serine/threonine protein kinase
MPARRATRTRPRGTLRTMADTLDLRRALMQCGECKQRFGAEATFCPFDGAKLESTVWDPAGDPFIGRVIDGRYEIVGVLGEGGMGTVYRVRHTALDRVFAMKVLRRDLARDPDLCARFMREARATAIVKHPNIVAITDFGTFDGETPYFVMEQLVGDTLARTIKSGGPIPAALGVKIVLQIAGALGAAHDAKIVHRDLKPDNVFLIGKPDRDVDVRIVDFGASMILGASRNTKTGIVFGTPHYMSPEQASGQPVDHRADIYALGIIMYEMFTGRVPFVADTYMGVLTQHMFVKPVPPSQVSEHARSLGALEDVLLRTLEKKPELRHASMQALADDIRRVSSFATDGTLLVANAGDSLSAPSRPVFTMANQLEPPTREEVNASLTGTTVRRRRTRARAWVLYGAVALGVATLALGLQRWITSRATDEAPPAPIAHAPPESPSGAPAPPPSPTPTTLAATVTPRSLASAAPPASVPALPRPRPHATPASPAAAPKKSPPSMGTDFADPWAK